MAGLAGWRAGGLAQGQGTIAHRPRVRHVRWCPLPGRTPAAGARAPDTNRHLNGRGAPCRRRVGPPRRHCGRPGGQGPELGPWAPLLRSCGAISYSTTVSGRSPAVSSSAAHSFASTVSFRARHVRSTGLPARGTGPLRLGLDRESRGPFRFLSWLVGSFSGSSASLAPSLWPAVVTRSRSVIARGVRCSRSEWPWGRSRVWLAPGAFPAFGQVAEAV